MSYYVWLEIDTGGPEPIRVGESINHTSNTIGMWNKALKYPFQELRGKLAGDCINDLYTAIVFFEDPSNYKELKAMEPSNGWGTLESMTNFIHELLALCRQNPKATIVII